MKQKEIKILPFKDYMKMNVTDLQKNIKSVAKTVNTRIRNNIKKGNNLVFSNWWRISGGKQLVHDPDYATKSGFLKEGYKKKKGELDYEYKKRLTRIYINYLKTYNQDFRYKTVEEYLEEWARRMGTDVKTLKEVVKFIDENDVMEDLWKNYGSDITIIVNRRIADGESYEQVMFDIELLIIKYGNDKEKIMEEFSRYGELLV